jgi:hypothetical protein
MVFTDMLLGRRMKIILKKEMTLVEPHYEGIWAI